MTPSVLHAGADRLVTIEADERRRIVQNKKCAGCIHAAGARKHAGRQTRINLIPAE
jgi:hypothetical protein